MKKGFESSCGGFIPISMDWLKGKFTGQTTVIFMGKSMVQILNSDDVRCCELNPPFRAGIFPHVSMVS